MPAEVIVSAPSKTGARRSASSSSESPGAPSRGHLACAAAELSAIARYYDRTIAWRSSADGAPCLLDLIDCAAKLAVSDAEQLPGLRGESDKRTLVVVDCQNRDEGEIVPILAEIARAVARTTRVAILSRRAKMPAPPIAGWEVVRSRPAGYVRSTTGVFGRLINRVLPAVPLLRRLSICTITILRPVIAEPAGKRPSLSIIIPARNERGNIEQALRRLPDLGGADVEVIFVEGHSTDGTWEEMERVVAEWSRDGDVKLSGAPSRGLENAEQSAAGTMRVRALQQTGCGKADAVRLGFSAATGDLVTILDADLTMPPEALTEFYEAYCQGRGDFINGDRLSLAMERGAMRPLNKLGNRFFAWALSQALDVRLADCLCGTKLFARHDCQRFAAWRADFGDRDPFGDFDLLFPAAALALGCVNVPVHYAARTYGKTNIHRFRDGARLLAMTVAGWWRLRVGPGT